ncbi:hypothetical protein THRCLA_07626 [Thraustotheca clavata]|uniref:SET domain-containing protein n=1 Tax=Thraustotheca clavata TaxID=74557 RepID=A0A1V9ZCK2_9STRA|nr:hypothetical protein THRCLA_07626 [Thraustotheca clavata]
METDLEALAAKIKALDINGLTWGEGHKTVPVAFGIKKLLVQCIIIDDLVLLDDITEAIEQFEDEVQSVDVASMNKMLVLLCLLFRVSLNILKQQSKASWTWTIPILIALASFYHFSPSSSHDKLDHFQAWFKQHGGKANNISLASFGNMGIGLQATARIHEKDQVLYIPYDIVICRDTVLKALPKSMSKALASLSFDDELLAIFLMYQKLQGEKSRWAPYIDVLPQDIPLPVTFSHKDIEELQSPGLQEIIISNQATITSSFHSMQSKYGKYFKSFTDPLTLELYMWAKSILSSRALTIRGVRFLVPFADMFNGKPHPNLRESNRGNHFLDYHHVEKDKGVTIFADRSCEPFLQLYEDYGDNDNYVYFVHHGFIMEDNPFDCASIELPLALLPSKLVQPFRTMARLTEKDFFLSACFQSNGASLNSAAAVFLQLAAFKQDEVDLCHNQIASCITSTNVPTLLQQDEKYIILLESIVQSKLENAPTQLQDDLSLLSTELSNDYRRVVEFRASRKVHLAKLVDNLHVLLQEVIQASGKVQTKVIPMDTTDQSIPACLNRFEQWIASFTFPKPKVQIQYINPSMGFGTFALEDITKGEAYLSIPQGMLLDVASAMQCSILSPIFKQLLKETKSRDPMHELLLHFMYERLVKGKESKWAPYIDLLPLHDDSLLAPLFYTQEEMALLSGTEMEQFVKTYQENVYQSYQAIKRIVLTRYPKIFPKELFTFEEYRYARHILDTRSIWWNGERHLVPILDMVNCKASGEVHATRLEGALAVTRAKDYVQAGTQLFENYGQPNWIYLLHHGFVLENNPHDCFNLVFDIQKLDKHVISGLRGPLEYCLDLNQEIPSSVLEIASLFIKNEQKSSTKQFQLQALLSVLLEKREMLYTKLSSPLPSSFKRIHRFNHENIRIYFEQQEQLLLAWINRLEIRSNEPLIFGSFFGAPEANSSFNRRGGGPGGGSGGPRRPIGRLQPTTCAPGGG